MHVGIISGVVLGNLDHVISIDCSGDMLAATQQQSECSRRHCFSKSTRAHIVTPTSDPAREGRVRGSARLGRVVCMCDSLEAADYEPRRSCNQGLHYHNLKRNEIQSRKMDERRVPEKPKAHAHARQRKQQNDRPCADSPRSNDGERKEKVWNERQWVWIQPSGHANAQRHEQPRTDGEGDAMTCKVA
jgi:hypothetical protein